MTLCAADGDSRVGRPSRHRIFLPFSDILHEGPHCRRNMVVRRYMITCAPSRRRAGGVRCLRRCSTWWRVRGGWEGGEPGEEVVSRELGDRVCSSVQSYVLAAREWRVARVNHSPWDINDQVSNSEWERHESKGQCCGDSALESKWVDSGVVSERVRQEGSRILTVRDSPVQRLLMKCVMSGQ